MSIYGSDQHTSDESCIASPTSPKIEDKWKVFAVRLYFSNEMDDKDAAVKFDELSELETLEDLRDYFRDRDYLTLWYPFQHMHKPLVVEELMATAQHAQNVHRGGTPPTVYIVLHGGRVTAVHCETPLYVQVVGEGTSSIPRVW